MIQLIKTVLNKASSIYKWRAPTSLAMRGVDKPDSLARPDARH